MSSVPLEGLRIVVTRPEGQAEPFRAKLESLGAVPILIPAIQIVPMAEVPGLKSALRNLNNYEWVVFTSANGVEIIWNWIETWEVPSQELETHQVAAIGPATAAALQERGVVAAYMPDDYVGESLGAGLPISGGDRVLLPRAEGSRPTLPELLVERGAHVDELAIYRSEAVRWDEEIERKLLLGVDAITFTSPSTVMSFVQAGHAADLDPLQLPGEPIVACIGPITASAAKEAGFHVSVTADKYTIPGLVEALQRYFRDRR